MKKTNAIIKVGENPNLYFWIPDDSEIYGIVTGQIGEIEENKATITPEDFREIAVKCFLSDAVSDELCTGFRKIVFDGGEVSYEIRDIWETDPIIEKAKKIGDLARQIVDSDTAQSFIEDVKILTTEAETVLQKRAADKIAEKPSEALLGN